MKFFHSKILVLASLFILTLLPGCFTEVGNAEDDVLINAQFKVDYSQNPVVLSKVSSSAALNDAIEIQYFYLLLHEAEYKYIDTLTKKEKTKHIWAEFSKNDPIDFTGRDPSAGVAIEKIIGPSPETFIVGFSLTPHTAIVPSAINYLSFKDVGYMKGIIKTGNKNSYFLFSLPTIKDLHLKYSQATLMSWLKGNIYQCEIAFFAKKWIEKADFTQAVSVKDMQGQEFILLDGKNNASLYKSLSEAFKNSFNTANVF